MRKIYRPYRCCLAVLGVHEFVIYLRFRWLGFTRKKQLLNYLKHSKAQPTGEHSKPLMVILLVSAGGSLAYDSCKYILDVLPQMIGPEMEAACHILQSNPYLAVEFGGPAILGILHL